MRYYNSLTSNPAIVGYNVWSKMDCSIVSISIAGNGGEGVRAF